MDHFTIRLLEEVWSTENGPKSDAAGNPTNFRSVSIPDYADRAQQRRLTGGARTLRLEGPMLGDERTSEVGRCQERV